MGGHVVTALPAGAVLRERKPAPTPPCRWCAQPIRIVHLGRPYWIHSGIGGAFPCRDPESRALLETQAAPGTNTRLNSIGGSGTSARARPPERTDQRSPTSDPRHAAPVEKPPRRQSEIRTNGRHRRDEVAKCQRPVAPDVHFHGSWPVARRPGPTSRGPGATSHTRPANGGHRPRSHRTWLRRRASELRPYRQGLLRRKLRRPCRADTRARLAVALR